MASATIRTSDSTAAIAWSDSLIMTKPCSLSSMMFILAKSSGQNVTARPRLLAVMTPIAAPSASCRLYTIWPCHPHRHFIVVCLGCMRVPSHQTPTPIVWDSFRPISKHRSQSNHMHRHPWRLDILRLAGPPVSTQPSPFEPSISFNPTIALDPAIRPQSRTNLRSQSNHLRAYLRSLSIHQFQSNTDLEGDPFRSEFHNQTTTYLTSVYYSKEQGDEMDSPVAGSRGGGRKYTLCSIPTMVG